MAGPISTFVEETGGVLKGFLDTIVFSEPPNGGSLPFRPDTTLVSSFSAEVQTKAADALRKLERIRIGISEKKGRGGMTRHAVRDARQVIRGARSMIEDLNGLAQSAGTMDLKAFKKSRSFSEGLGPMVRWLLPRLSKALEGHGPILAEWSTIASKFHCVVFTAVVVGGFFCVG